MATAPIDISLSNITGNCQLKCSYNFNYKIAHVLQQTEVIISNYHMINPRRRQYHITQ